MKIQNAFERYFDRKPLVTVVNKVEVGDRLCIKCFKSLPIDMFHRNGKNAKTGAPRWRATCKDCYNNQVSRKARSKKWAAK